MKNLQTYEVLRDNVDFMDFISEKRRTVCKTHTARLSYVFKGDPV